jgi:hypothetical protein
MAEKWVRLLVGFPLWSFTRGFAIQLVTDG